MPGAYRFALPIFVFAMLLVGCAPQSAAPAGGGAAKPTVRVGSTNFTEQLILAELYAQALTANGYTVDRKLNLGNREVVAPALETGQIDLYPEYLASYLTFVSKDPTKASTDAQASFKNLQDALKAKSLTPLDFATAIDANGFAVTKATADRHKLAKLSDLAPISSQLVLGGPPECPTRPFCLQGLTQTYGVQFKEFKALDAAGPITVAALEGNQVDVGMLLTTSAVIQAKGFVLLEDDKKLQLADNVVPVVRDELLNRAPADFRATINSVTGKLTTAELTGLNKQVEIDRMDAKDAAAAWLKAKGITR
jgi:osmoprotectant transport system substrate-binding protein